MIREITVNPYWLSDMICDQHSDAAREGRLASNRALDPFQQWVAELGRREGEWLAHRCGRGGRFWL
jgi:hypothetical protein